MKEPTLRVTCPADFSHVVALDRPVAKGEVVDVADELGDALVLQGWKPERPKKSTSAKPTWSKSAPDAAPTEE